MEKETLPTERVFISYSHDGEDHEKRVLALSNRLREEGIDCIIDKYRPHPPEGWPKWMEKQLENAGFVLVICTGAYWRRGCLPPG